MTTQLRVSTQAAGATAHSAQARATAHDSVHHHDGDSTTVLGFWIYLMTDCLLFAGLFAAYAVLHHNTAGGPIGKEIFDLPYVMVETFLLLGSSLTSGLAMLAIRKGDKSMLQVWMLATFVFGAIFVGMEINEFSHLIAEGAGPGRSAFLSSFFTLVGTHGLHVTCGLLWIVVLMLQTHFRGITADVKRRMNCFALFWHFLDIIWIGVFTTIYIFGAM